MVPLLRCSVNPSMGQVRIYAALNDLEVGVLELIEDQVAPWLTQRVELHGITGVASQALIDPSWLLDDTVVAT